MGWKLGVDGGASKTECILIDPKGGVAARHSAAGCNPSVIGPEEARKRAHECLIRTRSAAGAGPVSETLLCMAGHRAFWCSFADQLEDFGRVSACDDSVPVLELATGGGPGLVLHCGTGSFMAARTSDGKAHYCGGLGWRFGDEGSGYDLGRRALARAMLEMQGSLAPSAIGRLVAEKTGLSEADPLVAHYYAEPLAKPAVATFAPYVLDLAESGEPAAIRIVEDSLTGLLEFAVAACGRLFAGTPERDLRAGLSGHILNHPFSRAVLGARAPFSLLQVTDAPIEGVRRLLLRGAGA
jgi:N-acetylglucosamine kinase-like BadF-type ATPase